MFLVLRVEGSSGVRCMWLTLGQFPFRSPGLPLLVMDQEWALNTEPRVAYEHWWVWPIPESPLKRERVSLILLQFNFPCFHFACLFDRGDYIPRSTQEEDGNHCILQGQNWQENSIAGPRGHASTCNSSRAGWPGGARDAARPPLVFFWLFNFLIDSWLWTWPNLTRGSSLLLCLLSSAFVSCRCTRKSSKDLIGEELSGDGYNAQVSLPRWHRW